MDTNKKWMFIIGIIAVIVLAFIVWGMSDRYNGSNLANVGAFDQSIEDSVIKVEFSSEDFGLAINPSQILLETQILPCDTTLEVGFDYCIYYKGDDVKGDDFESAGIRIKKRGDLATESVCLNTPPRGFEENMAPNTLKPQTEVSTSLFKDLNSSGTDYVSTGSLYRLFYKDSADCYEFEKKITHMSDNPEEPVGSDAEVQRNELNTLFDGILKKVVVAGDLGDVFP